MMPTINIEHNDFSSLSSCIDITAEPVIVNAAPCLYFIDLPHYNMDYKLHHCS